MPPQIFDEVSANFETQASLCATSLTRLLGPLDQEAEVLGLGTLGTPLRARRRAIGLMSAALHTPTGVSFKLRILDLANLLPTV